MAIDWTAIAAITGGTGLVEYRVDDTGVVRWRGAVTLTGTLAQFPIPVAARPYGVETTLYINYVSGNRGIHVPASGTVLYFGLAGGRVAGHVIDAGNVAWAGNIPPVTVLPHSLENVVSGLAVALGTIAGLRVYPYPADQIESPAVVLTLPDSPYSIVEGSGNSYEWTFPVWLFIGKANDRAAAAELRKYLEPAGAFSLKQAIESDRSLGGACDSVSVLGVTTSIALVAGTAYLAAEFSLEVIG